ncbi:MAG: poly-gamma-glutamate system protein [Myxococcota bacterium]
MKKLYWRPPGISVAALTLVAIVATATFVAIERFPVVRKQARYGDKIAAARLAREGMAAIQTEKERLGHFVDPAVDPARTGMIGESLTPVTSNTGFLSAKLTSTNPNFAAVVVHLLDEAGVEKSDTVAVGVSGSFPALNLATYAAMHTLGVRPLIIASTSSSEWGANHVDYVWLDMERTLRQSGLIPFASLAASQGGIDDLGIGLTEAGRDLLQAAMVRNEVRRLDVASLRDSIDQRMSLFDEAAGDAEIAAYINVGGGSASVGTHVGKKQFKAGLNLRTPRAPNLADSVMLRFSARDVPVIHISRVKILAARYALPYEPRAPVAIGESNVFRATEYDPRLAGLGLVLIIATMVGLLRWSVGARLLGNLRPRPRAKTPEQMV